MEPRQVETFLVFGPFNLSREKFTEAVVVFLTWILVRLEALLEESRDVGESIFFHLLDVLDLRLRGDVPRESPAEPVNDVEQENFEITSSGNTWKQKRKVRIWCHGVFPEWKCKK
jgi:hypothetical protein